jgi:hypothetical protein
MQQHNSANERRRARESDPAVVERLESLDDVIFPAIDGDAQAVAQSKPLWEQTVAELGPDAVRESQHEYLRYARSTWDFLKENTAVNRGRLMALLQLIAMLSGMDM